MPKPKCPYSFPHKSRAAKVDYICSIGGYSSRDGTFPIEFNVATYDADLDFDNILKLVNQEHGEFTGADAPAEERIWTTAVHNVYEKHKEHLWDWGVESAQRDLFESDTYHMFWNGDRRIDVKLELHGRGGKHLVIRRFEGFDFRDFSADRLRNLLMEQTNADGHCIYDDATLHKGHEWACGGEFVNRLYRYVRQCEVDFTPKKASEAVEYGAAFQVCVQAEAEYDLLTEMLEDRNVVSNAAHIVYEELRHYGRAGRGPEEEQAFVVLCLAAGISPAAIAAM